jgi:glutamate synthase (NADPH) large chain
MDLCIHRASERRHPNWSHPDHDACGTGFVTRLGAPPNHDIIEYGLTALERLTHRGGVDADGASGDGAGLLTSIPDAFFRARAKEQGIDLPEHFGLGFAFLPAAAASEARSAIEAAADTERLRVVGWRRVPVSTNCLGRLALETMPEIWQFLVAAGAAAQARRVGDAGAKLHLLAIVVKRGVQGAADSLAISSVLRRLAGHHFRDNLRGVSPALFDKYAAFLGSGPAFPVRGA